MKTCYRVKAKYIDSSDYMDYTHTSDELKSLDAAIQYKARLAKRLKNIQKIWIEELTIKLVENA